MINFHFLKNVKKDSYSYEVNLMYPMKTNDKKAKIIKINKISLLI